MALPRTARRRVWKVLKAAREEAQANGQQSTNPKRFDQTLRVVLTAVLHPSARYKKDDADCCHPERAFAAEKTMVYSARNKADP